MPIPPEVVRDIETLKRAVAEHRVVATPLGVFALRTYAAYTGVNPRTGEGVPVPSKKVPYLHVDEQLTVAVLGKPAEPRRPEPARVFVVRAIDPETGETAASQATHVPGEEDLGPVVDEVPAAMVTCAALHAHVLATLAGKRAVKYSGFGNFVRVARPTRLEFVPSQVWKAELNSDR